MRNKLLPLLFCIFSFGLLQSEELEITLPTKNKELSLYFSSCKGGNDLAKLIDYVIGEDFAVDGRGSISQKNDSLLSQENVKGKGLYTSDIWKKNRIDYVLFPKLEGDALTLEILNVRTSTVKTLSKIAMSKNKTENVLLLHKISDFLMQELFGSKGIASKRILYSFKPHVVGDLEAHGNWSAEIYETDTLGLVKTRVTHENSYSITPDFLSSGDGNENYEFVYVTYKIGQPQICYGTKNGETKTSLIKLRGNQLLPRMSFDNKYITFISDASGRSDIFIQKVDASHAPTGKPMQVYSNRSGTSASPHLSPDNTLLTFVSDKSGRAKVYIADITKTLTSRTMPYVEMVHCPCSECTAPTFSPDGKKIAFSGRVNGRRQIWIYDISEKKAYQLTTGDEDKENPCFGADSRHIVYNTTSPTTDIFLLSIEGNKTRRLTEGAGEKHYPAFEK